MRARLATRGRCGGLLAASRTADCFPDLVRRDHDYVQDCPARVLLGAEHPWIEFAKGQNKDNLVEGYRQQFAADEGVVLVGVAQERAKAWAATKQVDGRRIHFTFNWRSVYVNHYYIYVIDREWGPAFIKVCGYAPYAVKVCLNAHEWAKRQARRRGIPYQALDNGFLDCSDPAALQAICDSLTADDVQDFFDRWVDCLPLPLTMDDRAAGFSYRLSLLQMEVSLTQVFDDPVRGREFFEEVIRDNLDLGRPDRIQLLVDRKVLANTPGRFCTRVVTDGILPSLHVVFKRRHLKQYCEVEMVRVVEPEQSMAALDELVADAEAVLRRLDLPYQVTLLCTGDLGFGMTKTFDLNVWAAGAQEWLEVSSISNANDYQARRANIRFRREAGDRTEFPHTLNGSGVALPRTLIAILENNQQPDGSVVVPPALRPYMGGLERISPP
jgi:tRNA synthetase class II core domain (G, H, P, S and T)